MPGGDRSGPQGEGSQTGRGLGYCNDNEQPEYAAPQQVLGFGFRRGGRCRGRGFGTGRRFGRKRDLNANSGFWPGRGRSSMAVLPDDNTQAIKSLKSQMQEIQNALKEIKNRLEPSEK